MISGGRNEPKENYQKIKNIIRIPKEELGIEVLVHGGAKGVDSMAGQAAKELGLLTKEYPAKWYEYGRKAGILRNLQMVNDNKDTILYIAFPGGNGTEHCFQYAKKQKINSVKIKKWDFKEEEVFRVIKAKFNF